MRRLHLTSMPCRRAHRRPDVGVASASTQHRLAAAALSLLLALSLLPAAIAASAAYAIAGFCEVHTAWADEASDAVDPLEDNQPESLGGGEPEPEPKEIDPDNMVNAQQLPDSSFIYDTLIADLATADSYMNNQTVQVIGEAIGDIITAEFDDDYVWICLESVDQSDSQVAVYMTREQSAVIDTLGCFGARGTTLQVRGVFHLACKEHAGLSDLHADSVSVMKRGETWESDFNETYGVVGIILVGAGIGLLLLFRHIQERRR